MISADGIGVRSLTDSVTESLTESVSDRSPSRSPISGPPIASSASTRVRGLRGEESPDSGEILSPIAGFLDALPPSSEVLRGYQRRQLGYCARALHAGERRLLVQLPTGGGKTHEIAAITHAAERTGHAVLILATRTRLVRQIHERLEAFGISHGVIAAEMRGMLDRFQLVQIASVSTLHRRCIAEARIPLPSADVVIFDEAHLAAARTRQELLDCYPQALRFGFTATPARRSGGSLSQVFDVLIPGPSIRQLITAGMLVPARIFCSPIVTESELKAVDISQGDFAAKPLSEILRRPKLVGDVVSNWLRIAAGRRTLVFAVDKPHGAQLTEEFCRAGVAAELLTDQTDEATREDAIGRLESGETRVIVNCFLLTYGIDLPAVDVIVLARPTRSVAMYLQMVGRGLRPAPGKEHCLLIDHGRIVESLGLPTADFSWSLDGAHNANRETAERQRRKPTIERPRTCPECAFTWAVSELGNACRECGWVPAPRARGVEVEQADLSELADQPAAVSPKSPEVAEFFRQAMTWYATRWPDRWRERENRGRWWAWMKTCERFELAPIPKMPSRLWEADPAATDPAVAGWLRSRFIRDCKARQAKEHQQVAA